MKDSQPRVSGSLRLEGILPHDNSFPVFTHCHPTLQSQPETEKASERVSDTAATLDLIDRHLKITTVTVPRAVRKTVGKTQQKFKEERIKISWI